MSNSVPSPTRTIMAPGRRPSEERYEVWSYLADTTWAPILMAGPATSRYPESIQQIIMPDHDFRIRFKLWGFPMSEFPMPEFRMRRRSRSLSIQPYDKATMYAFWRNRFKFSDPHRTGIYLWHQLGTDNFQGLTKFRISSLSLELSGALRDRNTIQRLLDAVLCMPVLRRLELKNASNRSVSVLPLFQLSRSIYPGVLVPGRPLPGRCPLAANHPMAANPQKGPQLELLILDDCEVKIDRHLDIKTLVCKGCSPKSLESLENSARNIVILTDGMVKMDEIWVGMATWHHVENALVPWSTYRKFPPSLRRLGIYDFPTHPAFLIMLQEALRNSNVQQVFLKTRECGHDTPLVSNGELSCECRCMQLRNAIKQHGYSWWNVNIDTHFPRISEHDFPDFLEWTHSCQDLLRADHNEDSTDHSEDGADHNEDGACSGRQQQNCIVC